MLPLTYVHDPDQCRVLIAGDCKLFVLTPHCASIYNTPFAFNIREYETDERITKTNFDASTKVICINALVSIIDKHAHISIYYRISKKQLICNFPMYVPGNVCFGNRPTNVWLEGGKPNRDRVSFRDLVLILTDALFAHRSMFSMVQREAHRDLMYKYNNLKSMFQANLKDKISFNNKELMDLTPYTDDDSHSSESAPADDDTMLIVPARPSKYTK